MKLVDWILGKRKGSGCWVVANENKIIDMVEGWQDINVQKGLMVNYKWIDGQGHSFITGRGCEQGYKEGMPVYFHNVGQVFGERTQGRIGSEFLDQIIESKIGVQMIKGMIEIQEREDGFNFPFKILIIAVACIIGFIILWNTGILQGVISDITPK